MLIGKCLGKVSIYYLTKNYFALWIILAFTNYKASSSNAIRTQDSDHIRLYVGSSVTISAPGNITKIVTKNIFFVIISLFVNFTHLLYNPTLRKLRHLKPEYMYLSSQKNVIR